MSLFPLMKKCLKEGCCTSFPEMETMEVLEVYALSYGEEEHQMHFCFIGHLLVKGFILVACVPLI